MIDVIIQPHTYGVEEPLVRVVLLVIVPLHDGNEIEIDHVCACCLLFSSMKLTIVLRLLSYYGSSGGGGGGGQKWARDRRYYLRAVQNTQYRGTSE